jgi:hypothetical protein
VGIFKEKKLLVFLMLLFAGSVLGVKFLKDLKKAESVIVTEWARAKYLAYLIETKAPPAKQTLLPEKFKKEIQKMGITPEVMKETASGGIELKGNFSWEDLGRLLSWMNKNNFKISLFQAKVLSEEGIFEVRMIVK